MSVPTLQKSLPVAPISLGMKTWILTVAHKLHTIRTFLTSSLTSFPLLPAFQPYTLPIVPQTPRNNPPQGLFSSRLPPGRLLQKATWSTPSPFCLCPNVSPSASLTTVFKMTSGPLHTWLLLFYFSVSTFPFLYHLLKYYNVFYVFIVCLPLLSRYNCFVHWMYNSWVIGQQRYGASWLFSW